MPLSNRVCVFATVALALAAGAAVSGQHRESDPWRGGRDGVHIRIGRSYHLPAGQIAPATVVVIGAAATIDGRVEDDVVVIGGNVRVGPAARVRGEITAVGGDVQIAEGAEVSGGINEVSLFWPEWRIAPGDWPWNVDPAWWAVFGLVATVLRLALTTCAAGVAALVAPRALRSVSARAGESPVGSALIGLLVQVLFVPALALVAVGLAVSLVGIPLLLLMPFAVLAFGMLWLGGFAGIALRIGRAARRSSAGIDAPLLEVAIGVWMAGAVTLTGQLIAFVPNLGPVAATVTVLGLLLEYLVWTAGLGAALTASAGTRVGNGPPPIPETRSVPATA